MLATSVEYLESIGNKAWEKIICSRQITTNTYNDKISSECMSTNFKRAITGTNVAMHCERKTQDSYAAVELPGT